MVGAPVSIKTRSVYIIEEVVYSGTVLYSRTMMNLETDPGERCEVAHSATRGL